MGTTEVFSTQTLEALQTPNTPKPSLKELLREISTKYKLPTHNSKNDNLTVSYVG